MNPICLCLLLPIACVISAPTHYDVADEHHELPHEFWTHHFGPDFKHAIHLQLEQTDLVNTGNGIDKHLPEQKDTNKKRSAYIIHKPNINGQENRTMKDFMSVHLLQPHEIETLEKEMISYAKNNKMAESPVVVNLPNSEASMSKNYDHQTPVVLNVPPVVYHSNPNMVEPHYWDHGKSSWSYDKPYENKKHHSYEKMHSTYQKMQPSFQYIKQHMYEDKMEPSFEMMKQNPYENKMQSSFEFNKQHGFEDKAQGTFEFMKQNPYANKMQTVFEYNNQETYEDKMQPPLEDNRQQFSYDDKNPQAFENKNPSYEDNKPALYEDKVQTPYEDKRQPTYGEEGQAATDGNNKEAGA